MGRVRTLFVLAIGDGNVMAPGTAAVMGAVPEAKAGVGSAMNDLLRQLGGALGVAVIGSVINTVYRDRMADVVVGLPAQAAQAAAIRSARPWRSGRSSGGRRRCAGGGGPRSFVEALGPAAIVAAGDRADDAVLVRAMPPARAAPERFRPACRAPRTRVRR